MLRRTATATLVLASSIVPLGAQTPALRWIELPNEQIETDGLPWYAENHGEFFRLPMRLKDTFRPAVWSLSQSPSGGRLRFRTDSTALIVRLEYPAPPNMRNMHAFGQTGVDVYLDGLYRGTAIADKDAAPGKIYEHSYYSGAPRRERDITLYLALYQPVKVLAIGLDSGAQVRPARPFSVTRPVVFYGTSITQGGCASRSGMSYQAILGRLLNLDFVNLGFSGNGLGESEVARTVASIDASCFVLDFAQNNKTVESLAQAYAPFLAAIRAKHPETPVLAITPIYSAGEFSPAAHDRLEGMRELIRRVASERIAAGDRNLQLVEGTDLLGPSQGDGLVDGTHPNDLGFERMAAGLALRLSKMLGLTPAR